MGYLAAECAKHTAAINKIRAGIAEKEALLKRTEAAWSKYAVYIRPDELRPPAAIELFNVFFTLWHQLSDLETKIMAWQREADDAGKIIKAYLDKKATFAGLKDHSPDLYKMRKAELMAFVDKMYK